ncbi:MAG: hypothetical protein RSC43_00025 [Clostridia bacterium]
MASKRGPQFWQHRVTVILWNEEKQVEELIRMFYPTADEAGMMVYLLVHTLDQKKFSAVQEARRGDQGYVPISKGVWNVVEFEDSKFAELSQKRVEKSEVRTTVEVKRLNDPENSVKFMMYFRTVSEADIATTLLNMGLRAVKILIANERRRVHDSVWVPFRTASFVPDELADVWNKLSKENQATALTYLSDLHTDTTV